MISNHIELFETVEQRQRGYGEEWSQECREKGKGNWGRGQGRGKKQTRKNRPKKKSE